MYAWLYRNVVVLMFAYIHTPSLGQHTSTKKQVDEWKVKVIGSRLQFSSMYRDVFGYTKV